MQYSNKYVIRFAMEFLAANHVLKGTVFNLTSCFHMLNFVFFRGVVTFILVTGV